MECFNLQIDGTCNIWYWVNSSDKETRCSICDGCGDDGKCYIEFDELTPEECFDECDCFEEDWSDHL